jgi:hypothetical protein
MVDKADTHIPKEAEKAANRLLYGTTKATEPKVETEMDCQDPGEEKWAAQWTHATVHSPDEINESHIFTYQRPMRHVQAIYGKSIAKDRDFRLFT